MLTNCQRIYLFCLRYRVKPLLIHLPEIQAVCEIFDHRSLA